MFSRLTRRDMNKPWIVHTECTNCEAKSDSCKGWNCASVLAQRLAQYEDTGLSPDELSDLQQQAHWEQTEVPGQYKCSHCEFPDIHPEFRKRCSNCGARMIGMR